MKLFFKILTVLLVTIVAVYLIEGKVFIIGLILGGVCAYFGFVKNQKLLQGNKNLDEDYTLKEFSDRFNMKEKLAVIRLCWLITGVDEASYIKSQPLLNSIYKSLNLPFNSETLQKSRLFESEYCCYLLKKHQEIDWIVSTLYGVTYFETQINKDREKLFKMYLDGLEVTNDKLNQLLNKINQFDDLINPSTIN